MFDDVIDWFKDLFGGATEEVAQGVSDTVAEAGSGLGAAQETAQSFGEDAMGTATETAQGYGEEALGGAAETAQGFQEQAGTVGGIVEDPGGAATDAATDHFFGDNR
ncbi:hypothetical protein [Nocardiopsis sp. FIRDI 009]|uniref:hypothetical protein n=1 Tax=Nocardiopsis sp. FIRDI 009 TaxID=714197 RepID=UPI000E232FB2|nr:hypothetical protein [Nocardiopsis sp. FIRDI 009]